ncbi:MAG: HAD family hydrolase [Candidatus Brocadiia bacterium]
MNHPRVKLVVFDMEGCLTDAPTVWEIMHRKLGTWESHGQPYWDRYRAGEFGYDRFARMDVAVWTGASREMLHQSVAEVNYMPGCRELLNDLSQQDVKVAIITNGLLCVAKRLAQEFGIQDIHGNSAVCENGTLTGEIDLAVPFGKKGEILQRLMEEMNLGPEQTAAIGDGPADIEMFRESGTSIAFCPSAPEVAGAAMHVVNRKDLRELRTHLF